MGGVRRTRGGEGAMPRSRSRILTLLPIAALTLSGLLPTAAVLATPGTAAASTPTVQLGYGGAAVKLANGQTWVLGVESSDLNPTAPSVGLSLARAVTAGGAGSEDHSWLLNVSRSTFAFSTTTGIGTLDTGTQANPVAALDLTFRTTKTTRTTCVSGSETVYTGTLSGKVQFATGLSAAGTISSSSIIFNEGKPQVKVDAGCVTPPTPCTGSIIWSSGVNPAVPVASGGNPGTGSDYVGVEREVKLSAPAGASRIDIASVVAPAPSWDPTTKILSVTSTASGIVTGSATLSGGTDSTTTSPCTFSGKKYTLTNLVDFSAKYSSPAGHALTAHTVLTPALVAPAPAHPAFYEIETVKPA